MKKEPEIKELMNKNSLPLVTFIYEATGRDTVHPTPTGRSGEKTLSIIHLNVIDYHAMRWFEAIPLLSAGYS